MWGVEMRGLQGCAQQRAAGCCLACNVRYLTRACVATREGIMTPCALADTALLQEGLPSSPRMLAPAAPSPESRLPLAVWLLLPVHGTAGAPAAGIAAAVRAWWGVGGLLLTALARNDVPRSCTTLRRPLRRTAGAPQIQPQWEKKPSHSTVSTPFYLSSPLVQAGELVAACIPRHAVYA